MKNHEINHYFRSMPPALYGLIFYFNGFNRSAYFSEYKTYDVYNASLFWTAKFLENATVIFYIYLVKKDPIWYFEKNIVLNRKELKDQNKIIKHNFQTLLIVFS